MNTKTEQLLGDINSFQENLDKLFAKVSEKRQLTLQSHTDTAINLSSGQRNLLSNLGFSSTQNIKKYDENERILNQAGLEMETIDELKKIKEIYGKNIIGYNQLSRLCEVHNLYFGDSKFFTGQIPMKNVNELEEFPFSQFASHYTVLSARSQESIIDGSVATSAKVMIVAPLNLFNLTNVMISNSRELIDFRGMKSKCIFPCAEDPIVILPFKAKGTSEIFFLIITHWDNSKSII